MNINIRRAVKEDCPRLMELIHELAVFEKAPDEVTVPMEHFVESGFGANPVWWAFVAETSATADSPATVYGFALYYVRYSTWKGQRLYLEDLLVSEAMRGQGLGKLLFERVLEEAKEKKYSGMVWQVLDWNEPAINFYKKYNAVISDEWMNCTIDLSSE
ncbi:MAG: GNAT family N-acetyltransferase [Niastella sp.]|nr:GNAT family N-acetyltransferase [Niastella sp.]